MTDRPERRILDPAVRDYLDSFRPDADGVVRDMEEYADENGVPIAAREVIALQKMLARATRAERILEVGTAIGYSAVQLGREYDVVTLERDAERIEKAREYVERASVGESVEIVEGDAVGTLEELDGDFDMVFIDAMKEEYVEYLDLSLPLLTDGGVVVVDNLLWYGQAATGPADESYRESTEAIREFNDYFTSHDRLDSLILPLDDGTGLGVKRE